MLRTTLCSLIGAAAGFLAGFLLVQILTAGQPTHADSAFISVFLGSLLAIGGAIAGAVIGGAAQIIQYLHKSRQNDELK